MPYTPKLLAATFMGSFDKDPADRFPALLDGRDSTLVTERAIAAAVPEEFVTALVSKTLGRVADFVKKASPLGLRPRLPKYRAVGAGHARLYRR